jgi:hypothetical protein
MLKRMRDRVRTAVATRVNQWLDAAINPRLGRALDGTAEVLASDKTLAERVARRMKIDYDDLACHVDAEDVAQHMDASDVASYVDASDIASEVSVDADDVVDRLDYKALAHALLQEVKVTK